MKEVLRRFAGAVGKKFAVPITGEPEDQIRAPFETLINETGGKIGCAAVPVGETALGGIGRPDYGIAVGGILCGHVELKAPGKGADPKNFKGHDKKQWERFQCLPNLLYSDGIEWSLYRSGVFERSGKFSGNPCKIGAAAIADGDEDAVLSVLRDFLQWKPIVPKTAKQLALYLAPLCRMLKNDVLDAINQGSLSMLGVAKDWRNYLFPDADNEKFADSYAQTVTFALLLARSNGADTLFLDQAVISLSAKNTLLGRALQVLTDEEVEVDVKASLGMLKRVIKEIPTTTMTKGKRDPWLHFYEDFLQEYDPKLRKDVGAYYTPLPVVHAQVRLVSDILRNRMDKPMGFAEGGVTTLDPSVGTGTYLLAIVEEAMPRVEAEEGKGAAKARASLLAQNLYGFEIMVGPYAVAALRMTRLLQDFGAGIPQDGVQVFLNNTLESPHEKLPELPMMYRAIGKEHARAKRVKESVPVFVCIGNPPYDRHEKASRTNVMSTGAWVRWGEAKDGKDAIFNDFTEPVRDAKKGVTLKNIYNLYAYFWRWGLWKVFEQPFAQTGGIVAFITASSFLEGDAFLGMRQKMRELCDEIWIIDLGGDGRGTQQEENVFSIVTPVAITIAVRYDQPELKTPATVHYTRIRGDRHTKFEALEKVHALSDLTFDTCMNGWGDPFRVHDAALEYFSWPNLADLLPWQHSGSQFKRTWPISPVKEVLEKRWRELTKSVTRDADFRESRDRKITSKVRDFLASNVLLEPIVEVDETSTPLRMRRYAYRSFDRQYGIIDNRIGDYLRPVLWLSESEKQFFFTTLSTNTISGGPAVTVSIYVPDLHCFRGSFGAKDVYPLYRDQEHPNLHPELLKILQSKLGYSVTPEMFACYLYGVLSSPDFVKKYAAELEKRELRLPIALDGDLFAEAVKMGKYLLYLHSFGERFSKEYVRIQGSAKCTVAVQTGSEADTFHYDEKDSTLSVGDGRFSPVSPEIWNFDVSGLKVVQSWLGYRMAHHVGRKSSALDDFGIKEWTAELTSELLRLLWILEKTIEIHPEQATLLEKITTGELLLEGDLSAVPDAFRKPPKSNEEEQSVLNFAGGF